VIALFVIAGLILATIMLPLWSALQRRRAVAELRSDWWPRFELEFRAYAAQSATRPPRTRRPRRRRRA
jgi:hypothetical protein